MGKAHVWIETRAERYHHPAVSIAKVLKSYTETNTEEPGHLALFLTFPKKEKVDTTRFAFDEILASSGLPFKLVR